jgi:hypothetical protein
MSSKLTVEDLTYLLNEDDDQGGTLRKSMASTAQNAINYWNAVLEVVGAEAAKPKQRKKRQKSADGKTHGVAILEALKGSKNGLTSAQIRTKMEKADHPIEVTSFHATMQNLLKAKSVSKRKKAKGSRDNVYTAK